MIIRPGEQVKNNPGNKRCRFCGRLITDSIYITAGCNNRCASDACLPKEPIRKMGKVKKPSKRANRKLGYLKEDV